MPTSTEQPTWIRLHDAARLTGVSEVTLKKWLRAGKVRASRPGRLVLVDRADLLGYIERHATGGANHLG